MRQECERSADGSHHGCANQAVLCGLACVCVLRSDDADDEASGDHAGDPGWVIVAFGLAGLSLIETGPIEVNAEHINAVETKSSALWISGRIAEQIGIGDAAEEAMDGTVVCGGNDDRLPDGEGAKLVPGGIRGRGGRLRKDLRVRTVRQQQEGDEYNRKPFHDSGY